MCGRDNHNNPILFSDPLLNIPVPFIKYFSKVCFFNTGNLGPKAILHTKIILSVSFIEIMQQTGKC